jgi:8-oxo-dGTP pyrophosphatase MutT (NUDIX family)
VGELVDWVDDDDNVIEVVTRRRLRAEALLHRGVGVIVRSTTGEVLVQRRSMTKDLHPGWWDIGAGGVVSSGETYATSAVRELEEELGVHVDRLRFLFAGSFRSPSLNLFGHIYEAVHDGPFAFNDGEVVEALFVTTDELRRRLAEDDFMPDSVAMMAPLIFGEVPG